MSKIFIAELLRTQPHCAREILPDIGEVNEQSYYTAYYVVTMFTGLPVTTKMINHKGSLSQHDKHETNEQCSDGTVLAEQTKFRRGRILLFGGKNILTPPKKTILASAEDVALILVLTDEFEETLSILARIVDALLSVSPSTSNLGCALPDDLSHVASCLRKARLVEVVVDEFFRVPGIGNGIVGWIVDLSLGLGNIDAQHVLAIRSNLSTLSN
jgi:hypothetical protein